ncbi:MAG: flagellar motor switch protein FliG [Treponemataceae bacterium]|nr:flagellar motor switch protein FliG [Treponemataceae bacterium]
MKSNDNRLKAYGKVAQMGKKTENEGLVKTVEGVKIPKSSSIVVTESKGEKYDPSKDSVYRRVAKFLLLIGIDEAAKILPFLSDDQTEKIIPEIASIRSVSSDEAAVILAEFENLMQKSRSKGGGVDTAKTILVKAFGEKRAEEMLEKAVPFPEGKPFEYMAEMDSDRVFFLLKDESAAVRALVISYLKPQTAADFINKLPAQEKTELIKRLAGLKSISPEVLRRVDQAMSEKVKNANTSNSDSIDGRGALADILKKMSLQNEKGILSMLEETDPELSAELKNRLFTTEDFLNCDDRFLQAKLQDMSEVEIAYLIADKDKAFRDKILKNISTGRGDVVLEEESLHKPMLKKDVDSVTNEFFSYLRRKWEDGLLHINGRDDDVYV